jgi:hypothetical protein
MCGSKISLPKMANGRWAVSAKPFTHGPTFHCPNDTPPPRNWQPVDEIDEVDDPPTTNLLLPPIYARACGLLVIFRINRTWNFQDRTSSTSSISSTGEARPRPLGRMLSSRCCMPAKSIFIPPMSRSIPAKGTLRLRARALARNAPKGSVRPVGGNRGGKCGPWLLRIDTV